MLFTLLFAHDFSSKKGGFRFRHYRSGAPGGDRTTEGEPRFLVHRDWRENGFIWLRDGLETQ